MNKIISLLLILVAGTASAYNWGSTNSIADKVYAVSISDNTNTIAVTTIVTATNTLANITPIFSTNSVVDPLVSTPRSKGQILVGATNLWVAVGLTTNDWLQIK